MTQLPIKTRATYSWGGNKHTKELGFMEGDVIEILKVVNDTVYFGESQRTKLKGFFPAKYVECDLIINDDSPTSPSTPISTTSSKSNSFNSLFTLKKYEKSSSTTLNTDMLNNNVIANKLNEKSPSPLSNSKGKPKPEQSKFTSSYVQQLQQLDSSTLSTDTGTSSTFGHSDFSATSAGSYMRHKEDFDFKLQTMINSNNTSNSTRLALNDILERTEKKKPKLFGLLGSKDESEPTFDDRIYLSSIAKLSQMGFDKSMTYDYNHYPGLTQKKVNSPMTDLERVKTVSGSERARRSKRVLEEQPDLILKPQESISHVNYEEKDTSSRGFNYNIDSLDLEKVDIYVGQLNHDPFDTPQQFTKNVLMKVFKSEIEVARAIYTYVTQTFKLIQRHNEKVSTKRMFESEKIIEIMQSCICTPHQLVWLYYLMADTAGLDVEIILGYLKHPFTLNETITNSKKRLIINHSWISIKVHGEYRFVDVILGNPTNELCVKYTDIWDPVINWKFYFLARPFHLIHTHSPRHIDQQHIVPPIDVVAQLSLPPLYSSAIVCGIKWKKYNSSIFNLKDYELYDFEIEIPHDYIVSGKFKPYDNAFECVDSFVQIYHKDNIRIAHFQGLMSKGCPAGFVYVVGKNEFSKKWDLLLSIPCFHQGKWRPIEWVRKVPGLSGVDVYLKEPKLNDLKLGEQRFDIRVNGKSEWVKKVQKFYDGRLKIGLFPPNKQIIELDIVNNQFTGKVDINKSGQWRLGVLDVKSMRWKVIAEWLV
ncbi:cytokinesis protein 3 [Pichia californica]|uniref:Cytokinesis protein 3 n=1 Tax=Pichia californica TaxID=460514 RepID=A0A9P6WKP4_9ASCO|nr:cytokinesis protein 3 [[Candida] californica]KAG0688920.1 cytokinesis protein 3 [[Candida] californica]